MKLRSALTMVAVTVVGVAGLVAPAHAGDGAAQSAVDTAAEAVDAAGAPDSDTVSLTATATDSTATAGDTTVTPDSVTTGDITIDLPADDTNVAVAGGDAVIDGADDNTTLVVDAQDEAVRVLAILENDQADTTIDYTIDGDLYAQEDGSVVVVKGDEITGVIAPAWAVDANGNDVATRYEVNGNALTQVVETTADTAFPVTADPQIVYGRDRRWGNYTLVRFSRQEAQTGASFSNLCASALRPIPYVGNAVSSVCSTLAAGLSAGLQVGKCPRVTIWTGFPYPTPTPWFGTCTH